MRQPHANENPDAVAAAPGQIESNSKAQIAPAVPADKPEPEPISIADACRDLAQRMFDWRRS